MIQGIDLKKTYDGQLIFHESSFDIRSGEIVGFYGDSGCGKSTLAKILCGVVRADEGQIRMDEQVLWDPTQKYDRKLGIKIQMVYQQPYGALDHSQKMLDGFYELIRYHHFARSKAQASEMIRDAAQQVGLEMRILNHLPHQISGGEAQRIAIARCLLFRPELLILDEATSMLDVSTQANVLAVVRRTILPYGGSVMLISHDRALVNHLCDRVYILDRKIWKERK